MQNLFYVFSKASTFGAFQFQFKYFWLFHFLRLELCFLCLMVQYNDSDQFSSIKKKENYDVIFQKSNFLEEKQDGRKETIRV